jgi:hypothetical protein
MRSHHARASRLSSAQSAKRRPEEAVVDVIEAVLDVGRALRESTYYNLGVDHGRTLGAVESLLDPAREVDVEHALRVIEEVARKLADVSRAARGRGPRSEG